MSDHIERACSVCGSLLHHEDKCARGAPPDLAGFTKLLDAVENAAYRFERIDSNANRDKLDARRAALLSAISSLVRERDEARDELQRAKFRADEFHQGDEDMETVVLAMWDAITRHRQRADAALAESAKLREAAARLKERVGALAERWDACGDRAREALEKDGATMSPQGIARTHTFSQCARDLAAALRAESDRPATPTPTTPPPPTHTPADPATSEEDKKCGR